MESLVYLANGRDYLLHVATVEWLYSYDVTSQSRYYVSYEVDARMIDVAREKVIGNSSCTYDTKKMGEPLVSHGELLANDAAYVKQALDEAITFCAEKISGELF